MTGWRDSQGRWRRPTVRETHTAWTATLGDLELRRPPEEPDGANVLYANAHTHTPRDLDDPADIWWIYGP